MTRLDLKIGSSLTRRKTSFILSTISLSAIVHSRVDHILWSETAGNRLRQLHTLLRINISNICNNAEVNLAYGIDQTEAITVASKVFDEAVNTGYVVNETILNISQTAETWKITVGRTCTAASSMPGTQHRYTPIIQQIGRTLQATIDAITQTIRYILSG